MNIVDRILVIDDDVELCSLVGEYLAPEGFHVESVHDGNRGLDRALSGGYLLVVLDVMLPGLNGFEVVKLTRRTLLPKKIPVVTSLVNLLAAQTPLVRRLCMTEFLVARPAATAAR